MYVFPLIVTKYLSPTAGVPVILILISWKVLEIVPVLGVISGEVGAALSIVTTIVPAPPVLVVVQEVGPLV